MDSILIVEDDSRIVKALDRQFRSEGFAVHIVENGLEAVETCVRLRPSAVVLDLMLPGLSGREICKSIKSALPNIPVIILSAVSAVADKVLLLEIGADDYVTKPFSPRELLARVQATIRRANKIPSGNANPRDVMVSFGPVVIDFAKMDVLRDGRPVVLTAHEFKLLRYLIDNADRVVTREQLLTDVWGYNFYSTTRTVDNLILKLRQKLEPDSAKPTYFRTVHGTGYKFVGDSTQKQS
jgi:DNA-binding response OmpR family regulator